MFPSYTGAPYHYDKEHKLPFDVRYMIRGGKRRRCVIQRDRSAGGHVMNCGRVIMMEV